MTEPQGGRVMAKAFETTVGERIRVVAFQREHLAPPWVDLRIGKWPELEMVMALEQDEARKLAIALRRAADAAEGAEEADSGEKA